MAKIEEETDNELVTEIKTEIERLRDEMVAKIEESRPETDEEPPEINRETLPIRIPDAILYKLLRIALNENACRNRGYILDGYPRAFKDACEVFLKKIKKFDEEGNEIEEEDPELQEGEEKSYDNYQPDSDIFPSSVLVLNGDDDFLVNRVKQLTEEKIAGTHYN
jgi:adenylate kinase